MADIFISMFLPYKLWRMNICAAEYAKLPLIPPLLQPSAKEYVHGVNFASGGAGILPETNQGLVRIWLIPSHTHKYL